jgi:uncharacterized protein (DUF433 family)
VNATTHTHTESTRGELGQGLYSLGELRLYVAYQGTEGDAEKVLRWLTRVLNPVAHQRRRPDYSFSDLVSLFVVRELLSRGVAPGAIGEAERYLRGELGLDRPFVSERIATDGRNVYHGKQRVSEVPASIESANLRGQQTMVVPIRDHLTNVGYKHHLASRWTPTKHVVLDPQVQFGEPVIAGTRIPTASIAEVAGELGWKQAAKMLEVEPVAAKAALRFERRLASLRG